MKKYKIIMGFMAMLWALPVSAAAVIGQAAPDFTAQTAEGKIVSLSDFKGKIVVLEWSNYECPFVKKHYNSGHMQLLQKTYTEKGVIWLTIMSSAPGKQGHYEGPELLALAQEKNSHPTSIIYDPEGTLGALYGAKTTPHMYIITAEGLLAYAGAIDSIPSADIADLAHATNYISQGLDALLAGLPLQTSASVPYGCSVKYKETPGSFKLF